MSHAIHSTFQGLDSDTFTSYATGLLNSFPTSDDRQQAISYLQSVNSSDSVALRAERVTLDAKRSAQRLKQKAIEALLSDLAFDYTKKPELFVTQAAPTDSELDQLLTLDGTDVYIKGRTHVGDLTISGDNVTLDGQSGGGSSRSSTLTNSATVLGNLHISGDNTTIRGIDFTSTGEFAVTFGVGAENVTFQNCKFTAGGHEDSKWFYGENLGGSVTITNCLVQNFNSWYLADWSSTSGEPQQALTKVRVKRNYFLNNLGSIASRNKTDAPTKLVQYSNNLFETDTLHSSFWDFLEGQALKVIVTNNVAVAPEGTQLESGKKGFFQSFSRDSKPWTLTYEGNVLSNLKFGGKIALVSSFYNPNKTSDDQVIDLSATLTNVTHAFSFLYKLNPGDVGYPTASLDKWAGGTFSPENIAVHSTVPDVINPHSYSVIQP